MKKKYLIYPICLILFLCFIGIIGFGSLLRHHYLGGKKFQFLQNIAVTISEIPMNVRNMVKFRTLNLNKQPLLFKHKNKRRFEQFIEGKRNALLLLPRYVHSLSRSVVDVIDLNNFEVIHTFKHDIAEMNNQVKNTKEFPRLKINKSPIRFEYRNPLLLEDGSLMSIYGPAFKIDFCSNLLWINAEEYFHHSQMLNHNGKIWVVGRMNPYSQYVKKYSIENFNDDAIFKINKQGKIILRKSVSEILIENDIVADNFTLISFQSGELDPIHLNDIEPALNDTEYWKKGDLFLSIREQSAIIHYRPKNNEVVNYITGPFNRQHDVDIISNKKISIFNNNNFLVNNEHSEVLIYDFEKKTFTKKFNKKLQKENFKTISQGLSHIFKDGSLMIEETNHGRIILFNSQGQKEWEYVNKDKNGDIGMLSWSRVYEDELFVKNFKLMVKNKKCLN